MPNPPKPSVRFGDLQPSRYPGQRLGLPEEGVMSIARPGRRISAFLIDSAISALISFAFFNYDTWATLLVFVVTQIVFIPTIGGGLGHRAVGIRVVKLGGGWIGVWRPVVRTLLLAILVPALVWDSDQRGFHDKVAGTLLIRSR